MTKDLKWSIWMMWSLFGCMIGLLGLHNTGWQTLSQAFGLGAFGSIVLSIVFVVRHFLRPPSERYTGTKHLMDRASTSAATTTRPEENAAGQDATQSSAPASAARPVVNEPGPGEVLAHLFRLLFTACFWVIGRVVIIAICAVLGCMFGFMMVPAWHDLRHVHPYPIWGFVAGALLALLGVVVDLVDRR